MKDQPNVVVFFTDQQRWDSMGLHGNPLDLTPNLDRVAVTSTHVANSFTCQPVCGPARSCLQTGLYATQTGCYQNGIPLDRSLKTLAHYFGEAGYQTGYIGKWHLGEPTAKGWVPQDQRGGYDYWLGANELESVSDAYKCVMYDGDGNETLLPGYRIDAETDAAIRFINDHKSEPFYLFVSFLEPHFQNHLDDYPPPDGYRERYAGRWIPPDLAALGGSTHQHLAGYWGMVKRLDEAYGRLLDALKSLGMRENTIVLFTSDHACHFKTRNSEYKRSCHEGAIRVPTVITGPGFFGGGHVSKLVSLVDLPPTLLDAARISVPAVMSGHSILPLLRGDSAGWPEEVFVQISEAEIGRAVRTRRWKYSVTSPVVRGKGTSDEYTEAYLYDMEFDPYELSNLIGLSSHRQVANRMKERLLKRMAEVGEALPIIHDAAVTPGGGRVVGPQEIDA